jgi:RHS repeat-associated protein
MEGTSWSGNVVTNWNDNSTGDESSKGTESYTATINWGDGNTSSGTISSTGGPISGAHTYTDVGTYSITCQITDESGTSTGTINCCTATVTQASLSASSKTLTVNEYGSFSGAVASFTDSNSSSTYLDFSATVTWPGGSPVSATVAANNQGGFDVDASNTFGDEVSGSQSVVVSINDDGTTAQTTSTLQLNDAPLTNVRGTPAFGALVGVPLAPDTPLASFTDTNTNSSPADFSASTISWGDGTPTVPAQLSGSIHNGDGSTTYTVIGGHTYTSGYGSANVSIQIVDDGGQQATATTNITVFANTDVPPAGQPLLPISTPPITTGTSLMDAPGMPAGGADWGPTGSAPSGDSADPSETPDSADNNNCSCQGMVQTADGAMSNIRVDVGGGTPGVSSDPIRYFDGAVLLSTTDMESEGFGFHWGQSRYWGNLPGYSASGSNGSGTVVAQFPYLRQNAAGNSIVVNSNGVDARYFDQVGSSYTPRLYEQETFTHDTTNKQFVLTDTVGDVIRFDDFDSSWPANQQGQFQSLTDPAGNATQVTSRQPNGKPVEVQRSTTSGGVTTTESYLYGYIDPNASVNAGLLANVTLRRQVNGGAWSTVRQVAYTYYDGTSTDTHGNIGDLRLATVSDGSGTVLETSYYRYYISSVGTNGYVHGLKYSFVGHSYERLVAALPTTWMSADGATVAPYADHYFEYDSLQRVTKEMAKGDGTSMGGGGGLGTFTYAYSLMSPNAPAPNSWRYKTVETLPDASTDTVYANPYGEVMLRVFFDAPAGLTYRSFHKYDSAGRLVLSAWPSAVTGYDETKPDLLNNVNGSYQYLSSSSGLIETTDYYASTDSTINDTTPSGVAGYIQDVKIQQGQTGTPALQSSVQYYKHSGANATVYPVATQTVYRNPDGTGAETTSYAYGWFANSTRMQSETVSKPVISAAQNGPGTADVSTTYFDSYGRAIWTKDADGFLNYTQYDPATGAVVKTITDVDTSRTGDFQNLPSGWSTPAGGGLHLITLMQVDSLGRTTQLTDPNGNMTYTVYKDSNHEVRTYPGWRAATNSTTGPIQVSRWDEPGSYSESLTTSATPTVDGSGRPTGAETISAANIQTLSRTYVNSGGQAVRQDDYFSMAGLTYSTALYIGTAGTNYYSTLSDYGVRGRLSRTVSPTGTITRLVHNGIGEITSVLVGTNDTPGTSNMVDVTDNVYDNGAAGDGNLTQVTEHPGGGAADRVTQNFYSWRDRMVATKQGVQASENDGTHRPILFYEHDNLSQITAVDQYDGDGVTVTITGGIVNKPSAGLLRAYSTTDYDDQGRVYGTHVFSVDQSSGAISSTSLNSGTWYDHRGDVIKTSQPGGLVTKTQYDGAGRAVKSFTTDGLGDSGWLSAGSVAGNNVLSQSETQYDADGNPILMVDRERFHDETGTGALGDPNTTPKARVSYTASYYDAANRLIASVDVGTNGGTAYTRPASVPAASDTVLVTSTAYNPAGWVLSVTDPRGIVTQTSYDNLGRTTKTIQAYTGGTPGNANDVATEYTYDGSSHTLTVKGDMPGGLYQTTQYVYGVTTGGGSAINSNDLLAAMRYPDKATGNPSSSQQETYLVNALGEQSQKTDRNGNVHAYTYDVLGRQTVDAVTTLGTGVVGSVLRLATGYDTGGRPYLYTSYDSASGGNVVNQVQQVYNGLGQLITEYQSTSGAVNTSSTPKVQYAYSQMAGGANHSRLISMTYPSGRVVNYNYDAGLDDSISRLSSISDSSATLEQYAYLGLNTVVTRLQPAVKLTYVKQQGDPSGFGDAGDQYIGLDRFGRVVDQRWLNATTGAPTDRFAYGYDRVGNRLYRDNVVNSSFGELYHANGAGNGYDNLGQLTAFARGTLSSSAGNGIPDTVASPSHSQSWSLDALGNWTSVTTDGTTQTRSANQQNQITSISGQTTPGYDANGNMITDQTGKPLVFDAWNRLVQVKSGSTVLEAYSYDALGRRVSVNPGTPTSLYYSAAWQVLEEQSGGSTQAQYVWSPVYVDALIERDRGSERFYVQQDANYNVTAIVDPSGNVQERYVYDPYGQPTILTPTWGSRSGSSFAWVYLHQGGRYDATTGLYNFRNRDYSPTLGRWMQVDPLGFATADSDLYRYAGDTPGNLLDPLGLQGGPAMPAPHGGGSTWPGIGGDTTSPVTVTIEGIQVHPAWFWWDKQSNDTILAALAQAIRNLRAIDDLLTDDDKWCKVEKYYKEHFPSLPMQLLLQNRAYYKGLVDKVLKGLESSGVSFSGFNINLRRLGGPAYVAGPNGSIHITSDFFKPGADHVRILYHELGRVFLWDELDAENNDRINDIFVWEWILTNLIKHMDEILALKCC